MNVYTYNYMYVWVCVLSNCVVYLLSLGQMSIVNQSSCGLPDSLLGEEGGPHISWDRQEASHPEIGEWSGILCPLVAFGSSMLLMGTPWTHWLTTDLGGILPLVHTCSVFPSISPVKVTCHCVCVCVRTRRTDLWQVVCIIRRPAAWWELRYLCPSP